MDRVSLKQRSVPAPGQAPLVAPNAAELLRRNATDPGRRDRPALKFADREWTHREFFEESCRYANLFRERLPHGAPPHVAVLLDNTPDYTSSRSVAPRSWAPPSWGSTTRAATSTCCAMPCTPTASS
jgi:hypothetical protein